ADYRSGASGTDGVRHEVARRGTAAAEKRESRGNCYGDRLHYLDVFRRFHGIPPSAPWLDAASRTVRRRRWRVTRTVRKTGIGGKTPDCKGRTSFAGNDGCCSTLPRPHPRRRRTESRSPSRRRPFYAESTSPDSRCPVSALAASAPPSPSPARGGRTPCTPRWRCRSARAG